VSQPSDLPHLTQTTCQIWGTRTSGGGGEISGKPSRRATQHFLLGTFIRPPGADFADHAPAVWFYWMGGKRKVVSGSRRMQLWSPTSDTNNVSDMGHPGAVAKSAEKPSRPFRDSAVSVEN
jgi:hypothetical protein